MPLNSVQQHVKGLLDQTVLPLDLGQLAAYITPPDPGDGTQPAVYVWGGAFEETRQTMPRAQPGRYGTGGFKTVKYSMDLWVIWFGDADDPDNDSMFPLVLDSITAVLRNAAMPVYTLADPQTGAVSDILALGERLRTQYGTVHATADQRWLLYNARIICDVTEKIQA